MSNQQRPTPQRTRATVTHGDQGLNIRVAGERARQYDIELLESSVNCLLECAERTPNLAAGLRMLGEWVNSFAGHAMEHDCLDRGFGLVPRNGDRQSEGRATRPIEEPERNLCKITQRQDGLQVQVAGRLAEDCDTDLCESILNVVLRTIEAEDCVTEQGILINQNVFNRLMSHALQHNCFSRGLGLVPVEPQRPTEPRGPTPPC